VVEAKLTTVCLISVVLKLYIYEELLD